jgi:hypothetical protein
MEITAKLIQVLDPAQGEGRNGPWKRQDFIVETDDQFPKKICISNWNDKIDLESLKVGETVTVSVNIESREYNGRWYTDVKAWRVESGGAQELRSSEAQERRSSEGDGDAPPLESYSEDEGPEDDLPF